MPQSDWDFSGAGWTIETAQYVSSPSSIYSAAGLYLLCRKSTCQVLPEGQFVTWLRRATTAAGLYAFFRNQTALGSAGYQNTYAVIRSLGAGNAILRRFNSGTPTDVGIFGSLGALSINTWYKFRVTWWRNWGKLRVRLERWTGSAWQQEGSDVEDATNQWDTSSVNRVGFSMQGSDYWDDTEIYGPLS